MIIKAKYVGPFFEVHIPGFENKTCKRGDVVKLRVPDGADVGGCWEIIDGADGVLDASAKVVDNKSAKKTGSGSKKGGK